MTLVTNPIVLRIRDATRALGLNRFIALRLQRGGYEQRFTAELEASICPGDIVWDVGANVGLYTRKFCALAGAAGVVYAFEPATATFALLTKAVDTDPRARPVRVALSDENGQAALAIGEDDLAATSRMGLASAGQAIEQIDIRRADGLVAEGIVQAPTICKIDVEGHELKVLEGFGKLLQDDGLEEIFVEVHFGVMARNGRGGDSDKLVGLLRSAGFKVSWTDPSHLRASRGRR
jgi:FkbM family methyltransferase